MSARSGMSSLISSTRAMASAGIADYSVVNVGGTVTFWDNDEIQRVLDRHRIDFYREPLTKFPDHLGGSIAWTVYQSRYRNIEGAESGTAVFVVEDGTGTNIGTANYTIDYARGRFVFSADTLGTAYYLTGRAYNLHGAVAEIWKMKAGHVADRYDIRTDTQKFSRSQMIKQYLEMAGEYDSMAGPNIVSIARDDGTVLDD